MVMSELDAGILRLLAAGESRSEPIARALGVDPRTVRRGLDRLVADHLVASPSRGTWRLTVAGQRAALAATVPEPVAASADLGALPAEHQAVLRLVEDAVVARRALRTVYLTNWPGFVLLGPTKTGKTFLGRLAARRFGLDPDRVIVTLMRETEGSLLGRRVQEPGGAWRTEPSRFLGLPLVVLDEYDKTPAELRRATFAYLDGSSSFDTEDERLEVSSTALVTLNDDGALPRLLPDSYLRRSVVFDTSALGEVTVDLDEAARVLARAVLPVIAADLAPPAAELPEPAYDRLRSVLRTCLTTRGWGLVDVEAMSRLALGRWAQTPDDPEAAVLGVGADYLQVTATRAGLLEADWPTRLEAVAGHPDGPIGATLATARARQAAGAERQAAAERATFDASLELAGTRERLRDALDHALRSAPRGAELSAAERAAIAEARGKAHPLREAIGGARSLEALTEFETTLEREVLGPLRMVTAALEGRRAAAEQERQRTIERKKTDAAARNAEVAAKKMLQIKLAALARRTTTRPAENVLRALITDHCLVERSETHEEQTLHSKIQQRAYALFLASGGTPKPTPPSPPPATFSAWGERLPGGLAVPPVPSGPPRRYKTKTETWYEDRAGRRYAAYELVAWRSEPVRAVLVAAATAAGLLPLTFPEPKAAPARKKTAVRTS